MTDPIGEVIKLGREVVGALAGHLGDEPEVSTTIGATASEVVRLLEDVPGMSQAGAHDFKRSRPVATLRDGTSLRTWKNPVGVDHVFLGDANGRMVYGGYVGWIHSEGLKETLARIQRDYT